MRPGTVAIGTPEPRPARPTRPDGPHRLSEQHGAGPLAAPSMWRVTVASSFLGKGPPLDEHAGHDGLVGRRFIRRREPRRGRHPGRAQQPRDAGPVESGLHRRGLHQRRAPPAAAPVPPSATHSGLQSPAPAGSLCPESPPRPAPAPRPSSQTAAVARLKRSANTTSPGFSTWIVWTADSHLTPWQLVATTCRVCAPAASRPS